MERYIEDKRKEMYDVADKYGLSDPRVLMKSRELDQLLNLYVQYKKATKAAGKLHPNA